MHSQEMSIAHASPAAERPTHRVSDTGDQTGLAMNSKAVGESHEPPADEQDRLHGLQPPSKSAVLHRSLRDDPKRVIGASGLYLILQNGQRILDATGGAAVACLGHGHQGVLKSIKQQMDQVSYCHSLFFSTPITEALATALIDSTEGKMAKAFIVSSGSEAMEAAVKMARQYFNELGQSQRTRFIARKQSYHGTTLGALSVGGHVARRAIYEPILTTNVSHVSPCYAYRGKQDHEDDVEYVARLAKELDDEFERVGSATVCAFVAEPVVGAALGCVPSVSGYFKAVKEVCDKHGALLILDEVMSGIGRCGTFHAWMDKDVEISPDIQTIGKGLGGGYAPVAAMLVGHKVVDVLSRGTGAFAHGQTYQGHPIACAAAEAVIRTIREERLVNNVRNLAPLLESRLRHNLAAHPHVGDIRGRGFFWGIEFVKDKTTKEPFDPQLGVAMGVHEFGMKQGFDISLYPGNGTVDGRRGDHILVAPPYSTTEQDITEIVQRTAATIDNYFATQHGVEYIKKPRHSTNGVPSKASSSEISQDCQWNPSAGTPDDMAQIPPV